MENTGISVEHTGAIAPVAPCVERDGLKYYPYTSEFTNDADEDVRITLHVRKPLRQHILTIAKAGKEKGMDSQREVLITLTLPEEREQARAAFEEFPLLVNAFAEEVFKTAGMGSVFKGK